ncbi:DUF1501 domain-containing protein [Pseudosulfitobacter sp. DSM 107133]|uniref:DUF1501 domain-containing protein n=1 Tax=Pseudosulfitobacter sp. DSM 107133 TaxID=2883100 RepID=UPI000DF42656|nr:DUF1501 domain-containing protein [Pseudosulfitobacter sp. DSM 107133]UOA25705.1 hypothetical protein DSM107133_00389 [Pseudosulfitobacter sp. DSM 107133]
MTDLSRRFFLTRSAVLGCSLAASPLLTPVTFAAAPWDTRLIVIILRGAMDGLDAVQPYGDPHYKGLRSSLAGGPLNGALDLDGFFSLHPALGPLLPMWQAGELGFAHAVSTPYRDKRSHFDGQDVLEAGTDTLQGGVRDGWLNRMLQEVPGVAADTAYAIGLGEMPVLKGKAAVANWAPDSSLALSPQAERLLAMISESDPAMHAALAEAALLSAADAPMMAGDMARDMQAVRKGNEHQKIAEFAAKRLRQDARVASFSLNGWDTHRAQQRGITAALGDLAETLVHLKQELTGPVWNKTAVVAMTEFGRTARENGTKGTDHGTGGLVVMAGGAIRGGKIYGDWPGLESSDLYEGRDLMPTRDVRAYAAWIMQAVTGLDISTLERVVFPGLDMGSNPGIVL